MTVADSTMSQFCSVTLKILFWKLQEATYCVYCMFVIRYSTHTIGSAKLRHSTYCKTMPLSPILHCPRGLRPW